MKRPQSNATSLPVPILTKPADPGAAGFSFALAGRGKRLTVLFKPMLFGAAGATGEAYLAAHCRSNLLWRSRGILLITKAPRFWSPRPQGLQRARSFKDPPQSHGPAGFSCPAAMSPPNLAHGNENHFCVRLLLPRSGQQLGVGSRPGPRRRRRQAIDARRRSRPLRNLLESAPDVDEEGPRRGPSEAKLVGQALRLPARGWLRSIVFSFRALPV
jgi:hypothetical protein